MHHGRSAAGLPGERFVVFDQNHDHIGNRRAGRPDRGARRRRRARASPRRPCCSRRSSRCCSWARSTARRTRSPTSSPTAIRSSSRRCAEAGPRSSGCDRDGAALDPQAEATFVSARLDWTRRERRAERGLLRLVPSAARAATRTRAALARSIPRACAPTRSRTRRALVVRRDGPDESVAVVLALRRRRPHEIELSLPGGPWTRAARQPRRHPLPDRDARRRLPGRDHAAPALCRSCSAHDGPARRCRRTGCS